MQDKSYMFHYLLGNQVAGLQTNVGSRLSSQLRWWQKSSLLMMGVMVMIIGGGWMDNNHSYKLLFCVLLFYIVDQ